MRKTLVDKKQEEIYARYLASIKTWLDRDLSAFGPEFATQQYNMFKNALNKSYRRLDPTNPSLNDEIETATKTEVRKAEVLKRDVSRDQLERNITNSVFDQMTETFDNDMSLGRKNMMEALARMLLDAPEKRSLELVNRTRPRGNGCFQKS